MQFTCTQDNYSILLISYEKYLALLTMTKVIFIWNTSEFIQKLLRFELGSIFSWPKSEWEVQRPCYCYCFDFAELVKQSEFLKGFFPFFLNSLSTYLTGMLWGFIDCLCKTLKYKRKMKIQTIHLNTCIYHQK